VTKGRIKTAKHVTLAMALKSLTSSRNVVDIVNKYDHSCSYTATEELETEVTYFASSRSQDCPYDIVQKPNLCTGLAYNNFDRFVETTDGKDTLHDIVGIIFQNIVPETTENDNNTQEPENDNSMQEQNSNSRNKRRRIFNAVTPELEPLAKRKKGEQVIQSLSDEIIEPSISRVQKRVNVLWMIALRIPNTPMWVGYNSLTFLDESIRQKILYMTTINLSPTNHAVVKETMNQAKRVAFECNERYMQVTYDLALQLPK